MTSTAAGPASTLAESDWLTRQRGHAERADRFVVPHLDRARRGQPHPVWDFLFTYYSLRPQLLRRWHPGYGVRLTGASARRFLDRAGYVRYGAAVGVGVDYLRARSDTVAFIADLLTATAGRPARLNCFGLHEWAMVYRTAAVRHRQVPLRLGAAGTDEVVESMPLRCTHYDAYRFFTAAAVERSEQPLTRQGQLAQEQPGCVHATMDLYKWAFKLGPLIESELVLDCLELAADARVLDMRASPYDLRDYGFEPIAVETLGGRREYAQGQQRLTERAGPLRAALQERCTELLVTATGE